MQRVEKKKQLIFHEMWQNYWKKGIFLKKFKIVENYFIY